MQKVTEVDKYLRQSLKTAKVEKAKGNKELAKLVLATASKVADYWIKQEQGEYHNDDDRTPGALHDCPPGGYWRQDL